MKRGELSSATRGNLEYLEQFGFSFGDPSKVEVVDQYWSGRYHDGTPRPEFGKLAKQAKSIQIPGRGPDGEPVIYWRKETRSPSAGQTYLITPHGNIKVSHLMQLLGRYPEMNWEPNEEARMSKKAYSHYKTKSSGLKKRKRRTKRGKK